MKPSLSFSSHLLQSHPDPCRCIIHRYFWIFCAECWFDVWFMHSSVKADIRVWRFWPTPLIKLQYGRHINMTNCPTPSCFIFLHWQNHRFPFFMPLFAFTLLQTCLRCVWIHFLLFFPQKMWGQRRRRSWFFSLLVFTPESLRPLLSVKVK